MNIRVVFSGRGYDRAESIPASLDLPPGSTLSDALDLLAKRLPDEIQLPAACLIAVSGKHAGTVARHEACPLGEGDELVLIAPVAGG